MSLDSKATPAKRQAHVAKVMAELAADTRPILLGPWRSEVGFESLYWQPFLAYLASKVPKFDQRAAIVTRGGLAPLYAKVANQGFDLYALRSVTDVRRENLYDAQIRQKGKTIKQVAITEWDDAVLADAAAELGLGSLYHVVHPSLMYWALAPFWEEDASLRYLTSMATYAPLPKLTIHGELPPNYVAMKWYARPTFPYPDQMVAQFVQHVTATVAKQTPVVLLTAGNEHDDHIDIPVAGENIHLLPADMPPEDNLKIQAAVIANAKAFVGTYGGTAQLALRLGVPSTSFYTEFGGTSHAHLSLSSWLGKQSKVMFNALSLNDAQFVRQVVAGKPEAVQMVTKQAVEAAA